MNGKEKSFADRLIGKTLENIFCQADILEFVFSDTDLVLHAMGLTRVIKNGDILITSFDYQSWDGENSENNDMYLNVEKYKDDITGGTVVSVSVSNVNDFKIEFDNGAVIECLVANAYPHYENETEQWVLFEHRGDGSGRFLTIYNKSVDFE